MQIPCPVTGRKLNPLNVVFCETEFGPLLKDIKTLPQLHLSHGLRPKAESDHSDPNQHTDSS